MSQHSVSLERPLLTNSQTWCTAPETQGMKAHVALAITSPFIFLKSLLNLLQCCLFYLLGFCLQGTCNLSSPTRDRTCIPRIGRQRTATCYYGKDRGHWLIPLLSKLRYKNKSDLREPYSQLCQCGRKKIIITWNSNWTGETLVSWNLTNFPVMSLSIILLEAGSQPKKF